MISNPTLIAYDSNAACKAVLVADLNTAVSGTPSCVVATSGNEITVTIPEAEIGGTNMFLSNPLDAAYAITISGVRVLGFE